MLLTHPPTYPLCWLCPLSFVRWFLFAVSAVIWFLSPQNTHTHTHHVRLVEAGHAFREAVSGLDSRLKMRLQTALRELGAMPPQPLGGAGEGAGSRTAGSLAGTVPPPQTQPRAPTIQLKSMFTLPKI